MSVDIIPAPIGGERSVKRHFYTGNIRIKAGCILLAAGALLLIAAGASSAFAQWYSVHIYPVWVGSVGRLAGILPFSLAELMLYALLIWILTAGVVHIRRIVHRREEKQIFYRWLQSLFLLAAVLFFLYVINCGINYRRESFSKASGICVEEYSVSELKEVCLWLTEEVNELSDKVKRDGDGVMLLSSRNEGAGEEAVCAMQNLGSIYEELSGYYPEPKGLMVPWILSVQNLTGVYSPFTIEANYNTGMTDYNIPFTMCHELSHLRGFMQEEEANFLAFLACYNSEEVEFRYSGNLMGWIYCMNLLYKVDYKEWEEVREKLSPVIEADLGANREYWDKYDGTVAEVANKVNDTYLKANGQEDGVKSYNRMADLIVAYFRQQSGK